MELIETSIFTRQIVALLDDESYAKFQADLALHPESGSLIRGGGGIRKIRVAARSHGKRGGARVIYYWAKRHDQILLLFAYAKNELADMNVSQAAELGKLVKKEFGNEPGIV